MKNFIILLLTIALTHSLSAQNDYIKGKKIWFDLQVVQQIGLNAWSNVSYVNDGFSKTALTEFRGVGNINVFFPNFGAFIDMSLGIMPAPQMRSLDIKRMPMPNNGTLYYLRDVLSESGNGNASAHFKMTFGLFGKIPANEKLSVMPYLGIGFFTIPQRKYEVLLKEHGSNIQYKATYIWNYIIDDYYNDAPLSYLTGRLNFKYKLTNKSRLLLGLEYTWFIDTLNFYGKYSNTFNPNIQRDFNVMGNNMNMLGITLGISFM